MTKSGAKSMKILTEKLYWQTKGQVRDQVWDQVWWQVRDQVWDQVWDQVRNQVWWQGWGHVDEISNCKTLLASLVASQEPSL